MVFARDSVSCGLTKMSDPKRHHHVAQFYLNGWCRTDGKLAVYKRLGNRVVVSWRTTKHTAYENHLYKISALPKEDQQWVEREVMSKAVDGPASQILKRLLASDLMNFNSDDRTNWARFILAQWYRSPEMVAKLRLEGSEALFRALEENPEEYDAIRGNSVHASLQEWVDANAKGLDEIVTLGRVLPQLINDARAGQIIVNMLWQVLHLDGAKVDLLTSDRPAIRFQGLNSKTCMIAIPLSPHRLFVASNYDRGFKGLSPTKIVKAANNSMVLSARLRIYGSSERHTPLIQKLFGKG